MNELDNKLVNENIIGDNIANANSNVLWPRILSRYSVIWIWSILVGLNSTLFISFFNSRSGHYSIFSTFILSFNTAALLCSFSSWLQLLIILRNLILPIVLNFTLYEDADKSEHPDTSINRISLVKLSNSFNKAFLYIIISLFLKLLVFIIESTFNSLG